MIDGYLQNAATEVPGSPGWARVWRVDLDRASADESALTSVERARALRFAFERDRRRFVAARSLLRRLLIEEAAVDPRSEFDVGPHGKPYLPMPGAPRFNLSHSGRHALIAISETDEIGVDIEEVKPVIDLDALAVRHFTARERSRWPGDDRSGARLGRFLRGWTRKEACLKALGDGLTIDTRAFETEARDGTVRVDVPIQASLTTVQVVDFEVGPQLVAAVARLDATDSISIVTNARVAESVVTVSRAVVG